MSEKPKLIVYATFSVVGKMVRPNELSRIVGVPPHVPSRQSTRPDAESLSVMATRNRQFLKPSWKISSKDFVESDDPNVHIRSLLDILLRDRARLVRCIESWCAMSKMYCVWMSPWDGGPTISPDTLGKIAELGCYFAVDAYDTSNDLDDTHP